MNDCPRCFCLLTDDGVCSNANCGYRAPDVVRDMREAKRRHHRKHRENVVETPPRTLARTEDPQPSHEAARKVSKKLGEAQQRAIEFVRSHPGKTATELALIAGDPDPRVINRRLVEVERGGFVKRGASRPCTVTKHECATWWPT